MVLFHDPYLCVFLLQQTTLYLQMLYDPVFKVQYTEEIADHYPKIIDRIVDKILKREKNAVDHFKILDSSLDRGMSTSEK